MYLQNWLNNRGLYTVDQYNQLNNRLGHVELANEGHYKTPQATDVILQRVIERNRRLVELIETVLTEDSTPEEQLRILRKIHAALSNTELPTQEL